MGTALYGICVLFQGDDDQGNDLQAMADLMATPAMNPLKEPEKKKELKSGNSDDLFSAHNFDIKIDLEVPIPCKLRWLFFNVLPDSPMPLYKEKLKENLNLNYLHVNLFKAELSESGAHRAVGDAVTLF